MNGEVPHIEEMVRKRRERERRHVDLVEEWITDQRVRMVYYNWTRNPPEAVLVSSRMWHWIMAWMTSQRDYLGGEIAIYGGRLIFRRLPIIAVGQL